MSREALEMAQQQQRYRVLEKLASGGMAEVFRAESAGLEGFKKQVAIKRVLPHLTEKKQFIAMFLDEARAHRAPVALELRAGLRHRRRRQRLLHRHGVRRRRGPQGRHRAPKEARASAFPVEEACLICARDLRGPRATRTSSTTARAQPLDIVHRDMSPPNVLITKHGEVKIVDFGLAKAN